MESTSLDDLDKAFNTYTHNTPEMKGSSFVKIFKDNKLLGKNLSSTDLDIIFSKVKTKGKNKITLTQFKEGVKQAAERKGAPVDQFYKKLRKTSAPDYKGTKTQKVDLHDDKSKYTGIYARGGPEVVDKGFSRFSDLSELTNRNDANVRGINKDVLEKTKE